MNNTNMHKLLEASLQLNLRLAGSIGILFTREDKYKIHDDVLLFITQVVESSGLTEEDQIQMATRITTLGNKPTRPITAGLLDE